MSWYTFYFANNVMITHAKPDEKNWIKFGTEVDYVLE